MSEARMASVECRGVSKSYGATVALEDVSISIGPGEVHALLGENGAGKSTLVKVLGGVVEPDRGTMSLTGEPYAPSSILGARRCGVAIAFQELSLLQNLTVAENLCLPKLPAAKAGLFSRGRTIEKASQILARFDLPLDPEEAVGRLSLPDRQRLEIVRAFSHGTRLLILDEPTASLSDVDWLFRLIENARKAGTAVLYISHRLAEVRSICSRATVLRNGRSIDTVDLAGADDNRIFEMMVGRSAKKTLSTHAGKPKSSGAVLSVSDLTTDILDSVSFELKEGEILGVAALEGQGQRDLFRSLVGLEKRRSGSISVDGKVADIRSPKGALASGRGMAFLPEERKTEGIFASLTTASNMTLPVVGNVASFGVVSRSRERDAAGETADVVDLARRYLPFRISDLSGGNQQKALLARTVMTGARILLLFDPTRGVDVGTKQSIYEAIRQFTEDGGSVLFYSSELPEITSLAQRCLVLYGGRIVEAFEGDAIEEQNLVGAMIGHREDSAASKGAYS
ncbi:sugar ABC transporter ATP-binding protein [Jiella avicenniae]|uniref:Sugar ABC transporter ATP-binding protein n=1 Tax=Jiella avicenniae TaxID=2907202 RepID=A0A9X1P5F9_9HYPH|nr:sugar ABC transporter ATP-binding protein [Jiella avicenniae]MCE7030169.1 sugar ABC transporter ATP-binding protein [Jiella avicenniae]